MEKYAVNSRLKWNDEDSLCECFFESIAGQLKTPSGTLHLRNYKIRGRGAGAPEKRIGADGIGLVSLKTDHIDLTGFFLFQAKKADSKTDYLRSAKSECLKMLGHSAASYLLVLLPAEVKFVGAMAVGSVSGDSPRLRSLPSVGFPRFLIEYVLSGIMLEPLNKLRSTISSELASELAHVFAIIGGEDHQREAGWDKLKVELKELGMDVE